MKKLTARFQSRLALQTVGALSLILVAIGGLMFAGCSGKTPDPAAGAEADKLWLTDFPAAQATAARENKLLLMDFTGSDWCSWCIKLKEEVFSQTEFKEYAAQNLVLLEVDFPQRKKQSREQVVANEALRDKFKIEGYPTIIVLDSAGKQIGQLGYEPGGPKNFIGQIEKLKKK